MSAEEFGEWKAIFKREQLHPSAGRKRHAQLLASLHNGPVRRTDRSFWSEAHFTDADPWHVKEEAPEPTQPTPQQLAAQVAQINARFES